MKNLIGNRYSRLTVIGKTGKKAHGKENVYLCKCDCGNTVEVRSGLLSQGRKKIVWLPLQRHKAFEHG